MRIAASNRNTIPSDPGVYLLYSTQGELIYIGKAKNLKKRVASYYIKDHSRDIKTKTLVSKVEEIEVIITKSEAQAMELEFTLIKKHKPRYNIIFKDDKSYPLIAITEDSYPKIMIARNTKKTKSAKLFGPFYKSYIARKRIQEVQKLFKIRTCSNSVFSNRSRPCVLYQINQCTAPCVNMISEKSYESQVEMAVTYLQSGAKTSISTLTEKMNQSSAAKDYEKAMIYRDQINSITSDSDFVLDTSQSKDIMVIDKDGNKRCISYVAVRNGVVISQQCAIHTINTFYQEDEFIIDCVIECLKKSICAPSKLLQLNYPLQHPKKFSNILSSLFLKKISVQIFEDQSLNEDIYYSMAITAAKEKLNIYNQPIEMIKEFQCFFRIKKDAKEITFDAIDSSHWQGRGAVSAFVNYGINGFNHTNFRIYNSPEKGDDDLHSLQSSLTKHLRNMEEKGHPIPDVLVIDGGSSHLALCNAIIKKNSWAQDIALFSVSKGQERKPGKYRLHMFGEKSKIVSIPAQMIPTKAAVLLQKLMDEAHRFSNNRSYKRRSKDVK